jgi:high-affinity iron transporter
MYHTPCSSVWCGLVTGIGISLAFGAIFAGIYYAAQTHLFKGQSQFIFNGVVAWIACIFITWLAFKMLQFEGWEEKWKRKLKEKGVDKVCAMRREK